MKMTSIPALTIVLTMLSCNSSVKMQRTAAKDAEQTRVSISVSQPDSQLHGLRVLITNPEAHRLSVNIVDKSFGVIHQQYVSVPKFAANYDLKNLGDGEYCIEVWDGRQKIKHDILISTLLRETRIVSIAQSRQTGF